MRHPHWLTIQRASLFLFLAVGVLLVIYALGFITGVYLFYAYGNEGLVDFYRYMQEINAGLLWKGITVMLFSCILFMLELGRRAAGIITLILVVFISAASVFLSAGSLSLLAAAREEYSALDLSSLNRYIERGAIKYRYSTLVYDMGLAGYGMLICSSLFLAITVICNAFTAKDGT
ncbi:MAG: hypothetical protein LBB72_04520 [Spirochaetaceae bacterium]|nr:hypothetical protein [Spirochaetaceae bacterium]